MNGRLNLERDARAVFLPAIDDVTLPQHIVDHLAGGGTSVLLGESREEYVNRAMSEARRSTETRDWFASISERIRAVTDDHALVAVDQELGGIQRLHDLVTLLPSATEATAVDAATVEASARLLATECRELGVNVVLAPIVDVVTGPNPWLERRTVSEDSAVVRRVASAFVRGIQASGRVAATAKHFPGHPHVPLDPAIAEQSVVEADLSALEPSLGVVREVIEAGVRVVMVGPTLVPAMDAYRAASRSPAIVKVLRSDYGFDGVVLSDDLDQLGVLRGDTMELAAVEALNAGIDWLLVAGTRQLPELVMAIVDAVEDGRIHRRRLSDAASKVRTLSRDLGEGPTADQSA